MEYALKYQENLKGLVISNMVASIPDYMDYSDNVLAPKLPPEVLKEIMLYETFLMEDATTAVVAYGCVVRTAKSAVLELRQEGHKVGLIKLTTLWPFPRRLFENLPETVKEIFVPEMNMGQLFREVMRVNLGRRKLRRITRVDGELMTPGEVIRAIKREGADSAKGY